MYVCMYINFITVIMYYYYYSTCHRSIKINDCMDVSITVHSYNVM